MFPLRWPRFGGSFRAGSFSLVIWSGCLGADNAGAFPQVFIYLHCPSALHLSELARTQGATARPTGDGALQYLDLRHGLPMCTTDRLNAFGKGDSAALICTLFDCHQDIGVVCASWARLNGAPLIEGGLLLQLTEAAPCLACLFDLGDGRFWFDTFATTAWITSCSGT